VVAVRLTICCGVFLGHRSLLVDHLARHRHNVVLDELLTDVFQVLLRVELANVSGLKLILGQLGLLSDSLLIAVCQGHQSLEALLVLLAFVSEVLHLQGLGPDMLVEVHQHILLERRLSVIDADGVVVSVQTVDKGLDRGLVQVTQVGRALSGLLAKHKRLGVDESEGVNDDLALDRLDGIDDDGDGSGGQLLERLLGVDIDRRKPATETGM
jgi:hypothetical protein